MKKLTLKLILTVGLLSALTLCGCKTTEDSYQVQQLPWTKPPSWQDNPLNAMSF